MLGSKSMDQGLFRIILWKNSRGLLKETSAHNPDLPHPVSKRNLCDLTLKSQKHLSNTVSKYLSETLLHSSLC